MIRLLLLLLLLTLLAVLLEIATLLYLPVAARVSATLTDSVRPGALSEIVAGGDAYLPAAAEGCILG